MQSKIFIKIWFLVVVLGISVVALLNYLVDPYGVFGTHLLTKTKTPNERVMKIDHIMSDKTRYNAFMLGSSTIGTTNPKDLEKYNAGSYFYNFTCSSANMYDFNLLVQYLLKEEPDIKEIFLQIDLTNMREYGKHPSYGQKHHYAVTGTPAWKFYLEYLTIFPFADIKEKLRLNFTDANATEFDIENSGMWFVKYKDRLRQKNMQAYLEQEPSFKKKNRRSRGIEKNFPMIMRDYQEIIAACQAKGVKLTVLITAYNHVRLDAFLIEDTLKFVQALAMYHDIWYFAGYNSITNDNRHFYEINHYDSSVGALKAAKIYHDKETKLPQDFGFLVTNENVEKWMQTERVSMLAHDKKRK